LVATRYRDVLSRVRQRANIKIRRAAGLSMDPPARCDDPLVAYSDVYGVTRIVHGDLPSMLVGGLGSLFFQMLHPHAMAGVAQHSRYQDDPFGRMLQTANFISATTFGSKESAAAAIERVLNVHQFVHGVADDGTHYDANDPHLLMWVHCTELYMFLNSYQRFGARHLSDEDANRYVAEMVKVANDLGLHDPPRNLKELNAKLLSFRPELQLSADGVAARDFISHGVTNRRKQRFVHRLIVRSAWSLLPPWAQDHLGVRTGPLSDLLVFRPATKVLSYACRLALPPSKRQVASDRPPSTTTT